MRSSRPSAQYIRAGLLSLNKSRTQEDPDYYLKTLYPSIYQKYCDECIKIDSYVHVKDKYNGSWIMEKTGLSPGPKIGKIQKSLIAQFGDFLEVAAEADVLECVNVLIEGLH